MTPYEEVYLSATDAADAATYAALALIPNDVRREAESRAALFAPMIAAYERRWTVRLHSWVWRITGICWGGRQTFIDSTSSLHRLLGRA